jgi:hypothetical protein
MTSPSCVHNFVVRSHISCTQKAVCISRTGVNLEINNDAENLVSYLTNFKICLKCACGQTYIIIVLVSDPWNVTLFFVLNRSLLKMEQALINMAMTSSSIIFIQSSCNRLDEDSIKVTYTIGKGLFRQFTVILISYCLHLRQDKYHSSLVLMFQLFHYA